MAGVGRGRHGFGRGATISDRGHDYRRGDFFNETFVRKYWKPWFESDTWVPSEWDEQAPVSPLWLSLLSIVPLQWIALAAAALVFAFVLHRLWA